jgi:hypothetical protein
VEGFERWREHVLEGKQMKARALKVVQRLVKRCMVEGFERWVNVVDIIQLDRQAEARERAQENLLAVAKATLSKVEVEAGRRALLCQRVVAGMLKQQLLAAFCKFADCVGGQRATREVMGKMLARMRRRQLSDAFDLYAGTVDAMVAQRQRQHVEEVLQRRATEAEALVLEERGRLQMLDNLEIALVAWFSRSSHLASILHHLRADLQHTKQGALLLDSSFACLFANAEHPLYLNHIVEVSAELSLSDYELRRATELYRTLARGQQRRSADLVASVGISLISQCIPREAGSVLPGTVPSGDDADPEGSSVREAGRLSDAIEIDTSVSSPARSLRSPRLWGRENRFEKH